MVLHFLTFPSLLVVDPQKSIAVVNEVHKASTLADNTIIIIAVVSFMAFFLGSIMGIKIKQWCNQTRLDASHHNHFGKPM